MDPRRNSTIGKTVACCTGGPVPTAGTRASCIIQMYFSPSRVYGGRIKPGTLKFASHCVSPTLHIEKMSISHLFKVFEK